jgi:5'-3' exonuclease
MGVKGFSELLKQCSFPTVHLSRFRYKKLAIDIAPFLFKYKIVFQDRWLQSFINLVCCLRRNNVHAIFVYDGPAPIEKANEKQERQKRRDDIKNKALELQDALETYNSSGEIREPLKKFTGGPVRLLDEDQDEKQMLDVINVTLVEEAIKKLQVQAAPFTHQDIEETKMLLTSLGVPHCKAPEEAEKFCCELFKAGLVEGVVSEDTDVLVYGATLLNKIDTKQDTITEIQIPSLLEQLKVSHQSLQHLAICLGTDYNKNMKGIGPKKSYKLIQTHGTIDEIAEATDLDTSILNHKRVLELFQLSDPPKDFKIPFCKQPDVRNLDDRFRYSFASITENMCEQTINFV